MDSGKTRTLGDVLTLRGEKNSTQLASLARAVYLADQLGMEAAAPRNWRTCSPHHARSAANPGTC